MANIQLDGYMTRYPSIEDVYSQLLPGQSRKLTDNALLTSYGRTATPSIPTPTVSPARARETEALQRVTGYTPDQDSAIRQWSASNGRDLPAFTPPRTTAPAPTPSGDLLTVLNQYRSAHPASEGIAPLADYLASQNLAGYGGRYMYGATPSNNELVINGEKYKVIGAEDSPSTAYWYYPGMDDGGGAAPQAGGADLSGLLSAFGSSYTDPETANFLDFIRQRVAGLTSPVNDPAYDAYVKAAQDMVARLQTPYVNPNSATAQTTLEQILKDVTGAPFTDSQSAALRAEAFDELTKARDTDERRTLAQMAALGHGKGSGTIAEALRQVDNAYAGNVAANERALTIAGIQQANQNRATAAQVSQALHDLALTDQQYNESRSGQAVTLEQAIAQAAAARRAEDEARQAAATQLMGIPVQLSDQRLQQALQVLGVTNASGGDATSILSALSQIAAQAQANSNTAAANSAQMWLNIGNMIAGVL